MLFNKIGYRISIPVNEEYVVRANIIKLNKTDDTYHYSYEINRNDTGRWEEIYLDNVLSISSTNVNVDIAKHTLSLYKNGFFDKYIESYEYAINAMELGF